MRLISDGLFLLGLIMAAVWVGPILMNTASTVAWLMGVSLFIVPVLFLVLMIHHYIRRSK